MSVLIRNHLNQSPTNWHKTIGRESSWEKLQYAPPPPPPFPSTQINYCLNSLINYSENDLSLPRMCVRYSLINIIQQIFDGKVNLLNIVQTFEKDSRLQWWVRVHEIKWEDEKNLYFELIWI